VANLACGQGNVGPVAPSRAEQIDQAVLASTTGATNPTSGDGAPPGNDGAPNGTPAPAPPSRNFGERLLDVGKGIVVDGLWGTVTGLWGAVTHPVETVQGIGYAITHPVETATAIRDGVVNAWNENPERLIGAGIFEVITLPLAAAKVSRATTLARVARVAENVDDVGDAARAAENVDDAAAAAAAAARVSSRADAARLLDASEGRVFGNNTGHARAHVPRDGQDPAALAQARPTKQNNTVFRTGRHGEQALRDIMNQRADDLANLRPGDPPVQGVHTFSETVEGLNSVRGATPTSVQIRDVTYGIVRLPNGDLHLIHFSPRVTP
jgi:hypothetical protein